jgi:predicted NBD/HSP70 family sugar kinase
MVAFDHVNGVGSSEGLAPRARRWAVEAVRAGAADPAGPLARTPVERIDSKLVLELAQSGDAAAVHIAERLGALLARVIAVLGSMFDPERVILSGAPSQGIGIVAEAARRALPTDLDLPAPDVVVSDLGGDVVVLGAVAAAVDLVRTHVLDLRLSAASAAAPEVTAAHP